ncbi:MAG: carboxypeptidase regulatory-like domain-containing protein, partial [Blastocatellia bacterium]
MSGLMQFFRGQNKSFRTALFVAAFLSGVAFGQSEVGTITGRATDPNGAVVRGATVKAKSLETGLEREAVVDEDGFYTIRSLPPGLYEINVTAQGFVARAQKVRVFIGSIFRFDPELTVTPVTGEETVIEGAGGVEINKQTGQISDPITQRQLNELPTITRDPYSLITLSGNVTPFNVNVLNVQGFNNANVITAPDQDFSIDGQAPTTNNVRLDGGENIVNYWSTLGQRIPLAGVREINVITNGFRPEYGRLLGGLIDVASLQGGNDWNGQVYYFYRGDSLASNSFDSNARGIERGHLVGNQPGYAVGGPIIRDKFFFFSSAEGIIQRSRVDRVSFVPTAAFLDPTINTAISPATTAFFGAFLPLPGTATGARIGRTLSVADTLALLPPLPTGVPAGSFAALTALDPPLLAFNEVFFNTPFDFGVGPPQDTLLTVNRLDYTVSDRSWLYGRYAYV